MGRVIFQVPSINAKRSLNRNTLLADEDEVGLPDTVVLGHRKRAESPIEGPASPSEQLLVRESLEVHDPDSGHLVHGDKSSLEGIVEGFVLGVSDG